MVLVSWRQVNVVWSNPTDELSVPPTRRKHVDVGAGGGLGLNVIVIAVADDAPEVVIGYPAGLDVAVVAKAANFVFEFVGGGKCHCVFVENNLREARI